MREREEEEKKKREKKRERRRERAGANVMSEAFGRALCSASAAQVVKNAGFAKASDSTVNTVGDLVTKYVEHVCVTAKEFCEHSQRTDANMVSSLKPLLLLLLWKCSKRFAPSIDFRFLKPLSSSFSFSLG